ncbi:branched-chain amino acid ABC transporter permease [Thermogladius sp. 4427co]|uniref:branched-chain amino acid ABC transporter permease n=1 Tax=Thermogladius sp. 4427co TaxID=3450718 RepID=UPI003F799300
MNIDLLFISVITGLMTGTLYALIGFSLTYIFGIMKFVNSAHGQIIMIGSYIAYWMFVLYFIPPLISAAIGFLLGLLIGIPIFYLVVNKLLGLPSLYSLTAAFALGIFIQELAKVIWGPTYRGFIYDLGTVKILIYNIPATRIIGSIASIIVILVLYYFLYKTKLGRVTRSIIQNIEGAILVGVDVKKIYMISFAIGIALTVFSGVLLTFYVSSGINPYMGDVYTNTAFIIAVMGGLGSPEGALIAGLLYGLIESIAYVILSNFSGISPYAMTRFVMFALLMLILLLKPEGVIKR